MESVLNPATPQPEGRTKRGPGIQAQAEPTLSSRLIAILVKFLF